MILKKSNFLFKFFIAIILLLPLGFSNAEEGEDLKKIIIQIETINKDLKTLEKAFYKTSEMRTTSSNSDGLNEDVLTRHLIKLNEIEEQFRQITNRYEEINFKIDKLSNRITKIQSDNQMRFNDIENSRVLISDQNQSSEKKLSLIHI